MSGPARRYPGEVEAAAGDVSPSLSLQLRACVQIHGHVQVHKGTGDTQGTCRALQQRRRGASCDVSAHCCRVCRDWFANPGRIKCPGVAQKGARIPLRRDPSKMGCAGGSGGSRARGKEPQETKSLRKSSEKSSAAKLTSPDMLQSTSRWEPRLEKSL